jgi:hypothetical protein
VSLKVSAHIPWDMWSDKIRSQPTVLEAIRNLTTIDLQFGDREERFEEYIPSIGNFVTVTKFLQSLRLSFYDWRHVGDRARFASLSSLFSATPPWSNLHQLALEGLETSWAELENLLNVHHATLRTFSLGHITIVPSSESLPLETIGLYSSHSWQTDCSCSNSVFVEI